jgi:ribosomal-protein-alanine N-acetyltransferase
MDPDDPNYITLFPILETERLILREPVLSDAADIFVFRSDPVVQKYNARPIMAVSEAEEMIERNRAMFDREDGIVWAVTLKGEDRDIGMVGFSAWSYHNRAMVGYDLAREYLGAGHRQRGSNKDNPLWL